MSLSLDDPCAIFVERTWACKKNQWLEETLPLWREKNGKSCFNFQVFNSFFYTELFMFTKASFLPVLIKQLISVTRILVNFSTPLTRFNSSAFFSVLLFLLFWYSEFSKAQYSNWNPLLLLLEFYFDLLKSGERMNPKIHDRRGKDFPSRNSLSFLPLK